MFKKTITYTGFDDVEHTQDFYFHISSPEVTSWLQPDSDFMQRLERVQKSNKISAIMAFYKDLITQACGVRSEDGKRFIQTPEAKSELLDTPALDELLMELMLDPSGPVNFLKNLLPKKMLEKAGPEIEKELQKLGLGSTVIEDNRPAWQKEGRMPTHSEFMQLSPEDQKAVFAGKFGIK